MGGVAGVLGRGRDSPGRGREGDHASPRSFSGREAGPRDATSLSSDLIIGDCDALKNAQTSGEKRSEKC